MRRLLLLMVAVAVAAGMAGSSPAKFEHTLYGLVAGNGGRWLTALDLDTLAPVGPRVPVGHFDAFAYDANGWLAFMDGRRVRIIDFQRMRPFKSISLRTGMPMAVAWLRWDTIVVVTGSAVTEVRAIDWGLHKAVRTARVQGRVIARVRGEDELVLLLAPSSVIGPARLLVVDPAGRARMIPVPRISAGSHWENGDPPTGVARIPALALDAERDVAYVVGDGLVAEVSLTGTATYHALRGSFAKFLAGSWRSAAWLGNGTLAVAGRDSADGRRTVPAGLELVDTRTWTSRPVDPGVAYVDRWQNLALGTGGNWGEGDPTGGSGLVAYDSSGIERFRALPGRVVLLAGTTPTRAYLRTFEESTVLVELPSGRVVAQLDGELPFLLTLR